LAFEKKEGFYIILAGLMFLVGLVLGVIVGYKVGFIAGEAYAVRKIQRVEMRPSTKSQPCMFIDLQARPSDSD